MEVFEDSSYREGLDRAKEAKALRMEAATRKFGGDKEAGRQWMAHKDAMKARYRGVATR